MSPRSRRRAAKHPARRPSTARTAPRIPAQRGPRDSQPRPQIFVPNDDALLVLHRSAEDPGFQQFLDGLPLVEMVGQFLEWVGDGVTAPGDDADSTHDAAGDAAAGDGAAAGDDITDLLARWGVDALSSSSVQRWRSAVVSMACAHWGLTVLADDGIDPGPDVAGWNTDDVVERAWVRSLVVAAALECTVRYVAAQHLEGDQVRHALATMLASAGEADTTWPLGLMSALRQGDLLAEHIDRVVLEHVTEMRAWGVLAGGGHVRVAPGAEPLVESLALGLGAAPVPVPTS